MEINYDNKSSFEFYQSIYDRGVKEIEPLSQLALADKFHYFRLYEGGRYFLFSNDKKYIELALFSCDANPPIFMKFIRSVPKNTGHFFSAPFLNTGDKIMDLFYALGWQNHCIFYFRHKEYVDCLTLCWNIDKVAHREFYLSNTPLLKSLYWLIRDQMNDLVPYDQPGVLSQFRKGADISYQPPTESFHLPSATQKLQNLLDDLSRKKLSLTPREWEVCKGLVRGETAKETARILNIQYRTVEDYLGSMYQKFSLELGYKPTRSQVIHHLHQLLDQDFINQTVWNPPLHK